MDLFKKSLKDLNVFGVGQRLLPSQLGVLKKINEFNQSRKNIVGGLSSVTNSTDVSYIQGYVNSVITYTENISMKECEKIRSNENLYKKSNQLTCYDGKFDIYYKLFKLLADTMYLYNRLSESHPGITTNKLKENYNKSKVHLIKKMKNAFDKSNINKKSNINISFNLDDYLRRIENYFITRPSIFKNEHKTIQVKVNNGSQKNINITNKLDLYRLKLI